MNTPPPLTATPPSPPPSSQEDANMKGAKDKGKGKEPEAPASTPSKSLSNSTAIWLKKFAGGELGRYEPKRNKWYCNCEDSNLPAHCLTVRKLSSPNKGRKFWACSRPNEGDRCGMFFFTNETEMAKEALEKFTKLLGVEIGVRKGTPKGRTPLTNWLASGRKRDAAAISGDEDEGGVPTPTPSRTLPSEKRPRDYSPSPSGPKRQRVPPLAVSRNDTTALSASAPAPVIQSETGGAAPLPRAPRPIAQISRTRSGRSHKNATPGPSSRNQSSCSQPHSQPTDKEAERAEQPSVQISNAIIALLQSEGVELPGPTRIMLEDGVEEELKKWVGEEEIRESSKGKGKEKEKDKRSEKEKRREDGKRRSDGEGGRGRGKGKGKGKERETIEVIELLD